MGSANTSIEWTDRTWNPIRGCTRVSPGCQHCYAERIAARFSDKGMAFEGLAKRVGKEPRWTGKIMLVEKELEAPLHWKKDSKIFVNSVSDLFHPDVPFWFIDEIFLTMALADWHTYQILTKRPVRMFEYFQDVARRMKENDGSLYIGKGKVGINQDSWPLENVWLGVSVENQDYADDRIPWLLKTPAAVRFLSVEPLLGPVNLAGYLAHSIYCGNRPMGGSTELWDYSKPCSCEKIHLVIVGGESGPGARPLRPDWVRSIRDQCQARKVNFFFKQWGEFQYCEKIPNSFSWATPDGQLLNFIGRDAEKEGWVLKDAVRFKRAGKKAAGRLLDGKTYDEMPTTQEVTA